MNIYLRRANESDLDLILNYARAYHGFEGIVCPDEDLAASVLHLILSPACGRLWLICVGTTPIGYVAVCFGYSIEFCGRDAFIDELFLDLEYRGGRVGTSVLDLVKAEMMLLDVRALHLQVAESNARALRLYRSAGFMPRQGFLFLSLPLDESKSKLSSRTE